MLIIRRLNVVMFFSSFNAAHLNSFSSTDSTISACLSVSQLYLMLISLLQTQLLSPALCVLIQLQIFPSFFMQKSAPPPKKKKPFQNRDPAERHATFLKYKVDRETGWLSLENLCSFFPEKATRGRGVGSSSGELKHCQ